MAVVDLRRHIEAKLAAASVGWLPFPHVIIEDFFPEDIYRRILDYNLFKWNDGERWFSSHLNQLKAGRTMNATPYHRRQQIYLYRDDRSFSMRAVSRQIKEALTGGRLRRDFAAPPEVRSFWREIKTVFSGDWFPRLVNNRCPEYFALRYGENVLRDDFWKRCRSELFLQRHDPDYFLGPHTDLPGRVFTCIFSFPEETGFEQHGTQLLRHREPYVIARGRRHFDFAEFETVKTAEYKPNNFLLFFKTAHSFHSVNLLPGGISGQRYGMQYQFREPLRGLLHELDAPAAAQPSIKEWLALLRPPLGASRPSPGPRHQPSRPSTSHPPRKRGPSRRRRTL
jgi:hypothetical protein